MMQAAAAAMSSAGISYSPEWLIALVARGGGGFVELRYGRRGFGRRHFLPASDVARDPAAVYDWTQRLTETYDVAMGMTVRGSKDGTTSAVVRANVLWADIDGDRARLDRYPLRPNLIVESGTPGHLHTYWGLPEPADLTELREHGEFVAALRGVQTAVGSDNVADLARIMRVPGSLNWKRCSTPDDDPDMAVPVEFRPEGVLV